MLFFTSSRSSSFLIRKLRSGRSRLRLSTGREFYIPETDETIRAKNPPIVIITSNAEKELPDAFLRRCAFHFIEFPDEAQMPW